MKDDEYFGFSTNGDFKGINLPEDGSEDDFKLVDLVNFDTEDDVRVVRLSDVNGFHNGATEQDAGCHWIDQIDGRNQRKWKTSLLPSSSALKAGCTRKRQVVKSAIVAVLVMMVLLFFIGNSLMKVRTGVQSSTASASQAVPMAPIIEPPTHAEPLIIDANHYYIQLNPDRAQILLDGHTLLHVPVPGVDPPLQISHGQHLITWRTNSHWIYSCTMSAPPSLMDTCVYNGPEVLQNGVSVWIISFPYFNDGN